MSWSWKYLCKELNWKNCAWIWRKSESKFLLFSCKCINYAFLILTCLKFINLENILFSVELFRIKTEDWNCIFGIFKEQMNIVSKLQDFKIHFFICVKTSVFKAEAEMNSGWLSSLLYSGFCFGRMLKSNGWNIRIWWTTSCSGSDTMSR